MRSLPVPGETVIATSALPGFGGKGANQAAAAARLGARTCIVAAVGTDEDGTAAVADLRQNGVAVDRVRRIPHVLTGEAIVLVGDSGENLIVVVPGANGRLTGADVAADLRALALAPDDVVLSSAEVGDDCVSAAAEAAAAVGARIVLNLAPVRALADWMLTPHTVLVLNEVEAVQVTGSGSAAAALELLAGRAGAVVVTRAARGALAAQCGRVIEVGAPRVRAVDSTGAGDALCGAVAADLAYGRPFADAVRTGVLAGAVAVTGLGARGCLATREMLASLAADAK